jgi:Ala-tRNA(Pro) deacylase
MTLEERILARLEELEIPYERYEHPPVATVEEARIHAGRVPGQHLKNLFLRDRKGRHHFLVVALADQRVDLSTLADQLGFSGLSLASERRLGKYLGVRPGAVSPLPLIREEARAVILLIDRSIDQTGWVTFHPGRNDVTLVMAYPDFLSYLAGLNVDVRIQTFG